MPEHPPSVSSSAGVAPPVTVVIPAHDAAATLPHALRSVFAQSYPGAIEVIVAETSPESRGGDLEREFPQLRIVATPAGHTPVGLNKALQAATHDIVARCDAHATLPPDYIAIAVETLLRTGAANVGGGQKPVGATAFEETVAMATTSALGAGDARYRLGGEEGPTDTVYLGVFRRDSLQAVGGFDDRLRRNQDYELNWRLRERGEEVWYTPKLSANYRPRGRLGALARQYFEYGFWKRVVLGLHPRSLRLRQLAAPLLLLGFGGAALAALGGLLAEAPTTKRWLLAAAAAPPLGYMALLLAGSLVVGTRRRSWRALRLPVVLATIHLSWGAGFLVSCCKRGIIGEGRGREGESTERHG